MADDDPYAGVRMAAMAELLADINEASERARRPGSDHRLYFVGGLRDRPTGDVTMTTLLDKMARAAWERDCPTIPWERAHELTKQRERWKMVVVLAAVREHLREPSEAMIDAGCVAMAKRVVGADDHEMIAFVRVHSMRSALRAMLDVAFAEEERP